MSLSHTSTLGVTLHYKHASKKGLGAVILQDSKPVMFASRALTGAEKKLPEPGEGMLSNNLGYGEISLFSLWKTFYA